MEIKKFRIRKVNEIGKAGLEGKEDVVLLFRELLYSFPRDQWKDAGEDEICDLIRAIESETDDFIKGEEKKEYSREFLEKQKIEEAKALKLYKKHIKKVFTYLSKVEF